MRANGLYLADLAFKTGQRAVKYRLAQRPVLPTWLVKTLFHRHPRHTGKVARHQLLLMVKYINAQPAVTLKNGVHGAIGINTYHYGGRRIGDGTDRCCGDTAASGVTRRGYDVDRCRQTCHRIAKTQTLFIYLHENLLPRYFSSLSS